MNAWEMPQVQALGEERLRLMQEAAEKCRGKSGMERLDIFLEYGEKLSEGGPLAPEEQKALLAAVAASLPEQEQKQLTQLMQMMGIKKERRFFVTLFLRKAAPAAALQAQASRRLAALFFPPREEKWVLLRFPFGKKLWWLPSFFRLFSAVCRRAQGFFFENT